MEGRGIGERGELCGLWHPVVWFVEPEGSGTKSRRALKGIEVIIWEREAEVGNGNGERGSRTITRRGEDHCWAVRDSSWCLRIPSFYKLTITASLDFSIFLILDRESIVNVIF